MEKVKLYKIDKYNKTKKFIDNSFIELSIDEAVEELKTDHGYHLRLEKNKNYIFFGDCDGFSDSFLIFSKLLKKFLNYKYNIKIKKKDISYTENKSKIGSFHYSIPKLFCSSILLKNIHEEFSKTYKELISTNENGEKKNCIDKSIYCDKWFRMPNQKKENVKHTEHIIVRGEIKDFIVSHIPKISKNIVNLEKNEKIIITDDYFSEEENIKPVNIKKNKSIKSNEDKKIINDLSFVSNINDIIEINDIKFCLNNFKFERVDDYDDWITTGMILFNFSNTNTLLEIWKEWSKKNLKKYKEGECENKWKTFKKDKKLTCATLLFNLKQDNKEKFYFLYKKINIKKLIMERKKYFPDNDLLIDNIIMNNNLHHIDLLDKFCPIIKEEHNKRHIYMEINKLGQIVLKCYCDTCKGREFPDDQMVMLTQDELKTIFNFNQTNYINITNINSTDTNEIFSEVIKLDSNSKIFEDDELNKLMLESLTGSDAKIAKVIFYLLKNKINCTKEKIWYEFKNHKWNESEFISTYLSDEFVNYYQKIIFFIINSTNISSVDKNASIKEIKKIIKILETKTRKTNIIDELGSRLRINNPKFLENLDTIPYIIGFNNGVYDLNKMIFRNGKFEDMISMSCNYDYNPNYSENKTDLINFLKDILPDDEDREYFLTYLSSCLIGLNTCELFTILTGKGRNGKSKLIELISHTMGDYVGRPKCKLLTGIRPDENSPEPGLLSLKKKRIVIVSEPEAGDKLNSGFIKFITGNDAETLRKCHKNEMEVFKANFLTFLVCNDIPDIDNMDNAFIKRLRCINFPTEFIVNPTLPHQKKIDETLQTKIINWKNDFMLLLLEYYKKFKLGDLTSPKNVLEWTNMYKEEVDMYYNFLNDCTEESTTHLSNATLYEIFQLWFKKNYNNNKIPNNRTFVNGIRKYKNVEKYVWIDGKSTTGIKNIKINESFL
jgi:P4 family phage/plasmid primase-like protien